MNDSLRLLEDLAGVERGDGGRECYAFSDVEDRVIDKLKNYATYLVVNYDIDEGDFEIKTDAFGNLFVTYYGEDRTKTVVSGSHVDSVLDGGDFDGLAGVNSAYGYLEKLFQQGRKPKYNYTAVAFRAEESSPKTGVSCLGSLVATGLMSQADLENVNYYLQDGKVMKLKDFFSDKYGEEAWQAVIEELNDPPLKRDEIVAYEEMHIEQSAVCEVNDADVGIVIDGIGGAIREKVAFELRDEFCGEFEVGPENPHLSYVITFIGEAAHTGGAPPNRKLKKWFRGNGWYRTDALLAAGKFARLMVRMSSMWMRKDSFIKLCAIDVPVETGFTTVPERQQIEYAVEENDWVAFDCMLERLASFIERDTGVRIEYEKEPLVVPDGAKVKYYEQEVLGAFDVASFVEQVMRQTVIERSTETGVGKVRGTATDFILQEGEVRFNLDYRDVDTVKIDELVDRVRGEIDNVVGWLGNGGVDECVKRTATKRYVPLDEDAVHVKKRIVEALGLKYVEMPSLPGHDAGCLAAIGVPVAMTYIRHDGVSHNRDESVDSEYYEKAELVSHAYLDSLLNE